MERVDRRRATWIVGGGGACDGQGSQLAGASRDPLSTNGALPYMEDRIAGRATEETAETDSSRNYDLPPLLVMSKICAGRCPSTGVV